MRFIDRHGEGAPLHGAMGADRRGLARPVPFAPSIARVTSVPGILGIGAVIEDCGRPVCRGTPAEATWGG